MTRLRSMGPTPALSGSDSHHLPTVGITRLKTAVGVHWFGPFYNGRMTPDAAQVASAFSALSGQDVLSVTRLSGGSGIPSWRVTTPEGVYAARLYSDSHTTAYGQAKLLSYLAEESYPVPEVTLVGTYQAQHLLALSWVDGLTVAEALRAQPDRAEWFGQAFGEVHARLHAVPVTPEIRAVLRDIRGPELPADTAVLVHLDYHPLNVMTDGSVVTSVIDWENVRLGYARYDLARTLSILCADPSIRALPGPLRQVARRFRKGYLNGYEQAAGQDATTGLEPFLEWAGNFMLEDLGGRFDSRAARSIERWTRWWKS